MNTIGTINTAPLNFTLPKNLECSKPTEVRGIRRDQVRLMVTDQSTDSVQHGDFYQLDQYLEAGDVLVVNTSGTLKAALEAERADGQKLRIHLSTQNKENEWIVELRAVDGIRTKRFNESVVGEELVLKNGGRLVLKAPYYTTHLDKEEAHLQLWVVQFEIEGSIMDYLDKYGKPIRYNYVKTYYPASYYQTVFAREMGSAEMPSAGRAFTPELLARLIAKGVVILPVLLHTGVASLELNERPYDEYYQVPEMTALLLNAARKAGRRIIAVGTTVVRAVETVTNEAGITTAGEGWTDVLIHPKRGLNGVDGLLTGFHEPQASHLLMLETFVGREHLALTYEAALEGKYYWHEFGDLHLLL